MTLRERRYVKKILHEQTAMLKDFEANDAAIKNLLVAFEPIMHAFRNITVAVDQAHRAHRRCITRLYRANVAAMALWHDTPMHLKPKGK